MINPKDIDIIFYHYPCQDGFTASWIANKYAKENKLNYTLCGINNDNKEIPIDTTNKNILFIDIAPTKERLKNISKAKSYYIIDHHKTNQDMFANNTTKNYIFDMKKCGARLAWEYFYPDIQVPGNPLAASSGVPQFLLMIEDRDLWTWTIKDSKNFCTGLHYLLNSETVTEKCYNIYDELLKDNNKTNEITMLGQVLVKKQDKDISNITREASKKAYMYNDKKVCMINLIENISEVGSMLVKKYNYDIAILWRYSHVNNEYYVSMRSCDDKCDVAVLCNKFGGGGHRNAAGCTLKQHPLEVFGKQPI